MKMKKPNAFLVLAFAVPAVAAGLLTHLSPEPETPALEGLNHIDVSAAATLERVFANFGYEWPPLQNGVVPPIAVRAIPKDIRELPVDERKKLFFRILAPLVAAENRQLREQREFLVQAFATHPRLPESGPLRQRVRRIASRFNVAGDLDSEEARDLLLRRVDIVPGALVLAQAANESGWGTSRFAREANNLFGMWTWDRKAGLAPRERDDNAKHFVRIFANLQGAVRNYLHTINVGPAYGELRELRAMQRLREERPDALTLAAGLTRYSARGEEYVKEIRNIIRYNHLQDLPPLELRALDGDSALPASP